MIPRFRPALLVLLASLICSETSPAQTVVKGKAVKSAPKAAADDAKSKGFDVRGPGVVKGPAKGRALKVWEVDQDGSGYAQEPNYVVGIDTITLFSDGRMRWVFYLKNKTERNFSTWIVGPKTYVADSKAETYKPTDMQYKPTFDGYYKLGVQAGTKERFWFDFEAPRKETDNFKVGLAVEDVFLAGIPFKTFNIKLVEPIWVGAGEPKAEEAKPEAEPAPAVAKATPKPATPDPGSKEGLAQALRDIPEKGQRYEGTIRLKAGDLANGGILFDKGSSRGPIAARLYRKPGAPAGTKLIGGIVEDVTLSKGIAIQLKDFEDNNYTFVLDGRTFSGTDTAGNRYTFSLKP